MRLVWALLLPIFIMRTMKHHLSSGKCTRNLPPLWIVYVDVAATPNAYRWRCEALQSIIGTVASAEGTKLPLPLSVDIDLRPALNCCDDLVLGSAPSDYVRLGRFGSLGRCNCAFSWHQLSLWQSNYERWPHRYWGVQMFCTQCGKQNLPLSVFCSSCGGKFSNSNDTGLTKDIGIEENFKNPKLLAQAAGCYFLGADSQRFSENIAPKFSAKNASKLVYNIYCIPNYIVLSVVR